MLSDYQNLITSEHRDQPDFMAVIAALIQPFVDTQGVLNSLYDKFNIDDAVGVQLDDVGLWVGQSRYLRTPLTGVYFSFDDGTVGFDQGTWKGLFDPTTGLTALPDDSYRVLLYAKIFNNQWLGNVPDAYQFLNKVFPGNTTFIQDNGDMSMYLGVVGPVPFNAVTYALFTGGYLDVKPAGVRIKGYITASLIGSPVFGFDANGGVVGGFDTGAFALIST